MAQIDYLLRIVSVAKRQRPISITEVRIIGLIISLKLPRTVVKTLPIDGAIVLEFYYFFRCLATGAKLRRRISSVADLTFRRMQTLVHSIPRMQVKSNTCSDPFSIPI